MEKGSLKNYPLSPTPNEITGNREERSSGPSTGTWLPGGTPSEREREDSSAGWRIWVQIVREQPRHTAGWLQLDDPYNYYYLAWARTSLTRRHPEASI